MDLNRRYIVLISGTVGEIERLFLLLLEEKIDITLLILHRLHCL